MRSGDLAISRSAIDRSADRSIADRPINPSTDRAIQLSISIESEERPMTWVWFVAGAVLSWGLYGVSLHRGQLAIGNPLKALLCVGIAYVLIAVFVPVGTLASQGELKNFNSTGVLISTFAGALGALGAVCIIFSFRAGASPLYVMPLVFGGAPLVNVIATTLIHPPKVPPSPMLYVGFLLAAIGAGIVLYYRPPA
jgi:hypothetical protein